MKKNILQIINLSDDIQNNKTNIKAKMTHWELQNKPGFNVLSNAILEVAKHISFDVYKKKINFVVYEMWGAVYKSEEYAISHDHWPAIWSCVYYLDPPINAPCLSFPNIDEDVTPEDGLLVMFPGWVKHEVKSKKFDGLRYVVSANLRLAY